MGKCDYCGTDELGGTALFRCNRCYVAYYCNAKCQRAHFPTHRGRCRKESAERAAANVRPAILPGQELRGTAASYMAAANAGDPDAMAFLGVAYGQGTAGVEENPAESFKWFHRCVHGRLSKRSLAPPGSALGNLANCYAFGTGVPKDLVEAFRLYKLSAEEGNAASCYSLGMMMQRGEGTPYDPVKAFKWLKRAADAGFPSALVNAGVSLQQGIGIKEDPAGAVVYFREAARQASPNGMFNLGVAYLKGLGVTQNTGLAFEWLKRAASVGHPDALRILHGDETEEAGAPAAPTERPSVVVEANKEAASSWTEYQDKSPKLHPRLLLPHAHDYFDDLHVHVTAEAGESKEQLGIRAADALFAVMDKVVENKGRLSLKASRFMTIDEVPAGNMAAGEFAVKVQIPTDGSAGPTLVYNEDKTVRLALTCAGGDTLAQKARDATMIEFEQPGSFRPWRKMQGPYDLGRNDKCFLMARVEEGGKLRVFLDKYAEFVGW